MIIRKAKLSDIGVCVSIHTMCEEHEAKDASEDERLTLNYIKKGMKNKDCTYLVAEDSKEIIGFISFIHDEWNNSISIDQLFVKPDFHGHGVGSMLLKSTFERAKEMNARIIFLHTSKSGKKTIKFYKKNGFSIAGYIRELYGHDRESDAVVLSRRVEIANSDR